MDTSRRETKERGNMIKYWTRELFWNRRGSENPLVCFDEDGQIVKDAKESDIPATAIKLVRKGHGWYAPHELEEEPRIRFGSIAPVKLYAVKK